MVIIVFLIDICYGKLLHFQNTNESTSTVKHAQGIIVFYYDVPECYTRPVSKRRRFDVVTTLKRRRVFTIGVYQKNRTEINRNLKSFWYYRAFTRCYQR